MKPLKKFEQFMNESDKSMYRNKSYSDGLGLAYDELLKIKGYIDSGKLKIVGGKRKWRKYILDIQELVWARNLSDGYQMSVYMINSHGHEEHIGDINNGKITPECDNFCFQRYVLGKPIDEVTFEEETE